MTKSEKIIAENVTAGKDRDVGELVSGAGRIREALRELYRELLILGRRMKHFDVLGPAVADALNELIEADLALKRVVDSGNEWALRRETVMVGNRLASTNGDEISNFLMRHNTTTKYELKTKFGLDEKEAEAIWTLFPSAFGPGGEGVRWFSSKIDRILDRRARKTASKSRHCAFYLARNGKWYMELADREYAQREDATTYGPFDDLEKAEGYLDHFSNPGAYHEDPSGNKPVPTRSPNGSPVVDPKKEHWSGLIRWGREQKIVNRIAAGVEVRPGYISYPLGEGPNTLWGRVQVAYKITDGVSWYSTAGHGGLWVSSSAARRFLTPQARELGTKWGGAYWYEEDVQWEIPFYEHPEWMQRYAQIAGGNVVSHERLEESMHKDFPEYFEEGAGERARANEPPSWKTLKVGDKVTLNTNPSEFVIEEGGGGRLMGRDTRSGQVYRMPTSAFNQKVLKIERDGRMLWEKR